MRTISSSNTRGGMRYQHTETVTDATSAPLGMPDNDNDIAVVVSPGTSARVEFTVSSSASIDGATATWVAWDSGDVTSPASIGFSSRVTALRLVSVGASTWEVSA